MNSEIEYTKKIENKNNSSLEQKKLFLEEKLRESGEEKWLENYLR